MRVSPFPPEGHRPDGGEETWEGPSDGSLIRLMSEDSIDVPLWGDDGLIFEDSDELVREWGVSRELASDIVEWGRASQRGLVSPELDAEAARLLRCLRRELDHRFRLVYQP